MYTQSETCTVIAIRRTKRWKSDITQYKLTVNVECRWRPRVAVARYIGSTGWRRWRRLSKESVALNLWVVEISRCSNRQLWGHHRFSGCHLDVVIGKVVSGTQVHPIHDRRPAAAVRYTTRHRDDVILEYGSRRWQVCWTLWIALCVIAHRRLGLLTSG